MKTILIRRHGWLAGIATPVTALILLFTTPPVHAQAPDIVGIDHVGLNVPDLDEAIKFFHDMFGFTVVTRLGPIPMDASWKKSFHIHEDAGEVTIIMMRAGDGSNIEIFGYKPKAGSDVQPYRDDLSATHFSLYTSDIKVTRAFLESRGIHFLTDIISGSGDTEGESWVYFETPWGSTIELNSYPGGKGYQKNHPVVQLWSASSEVSLISATFSITELQVLAARHFAVWNEPDAGVRLKTISGPYAANVSFFDQGVSVIGLEKLNQFITELQHKNPGFSFSLIKIDNNNNLVRLYWNFGPASRPDLISGMDLMILENGKIRSLSAFLDHVPPPSKK